ncbi:MAG: hypothetical protein MMC33_005478 [Icmadophila ericetorum]|nr:hypothetical protein [Icmadophila ericetorum]
MKFSLLFSSAIFATSIFAAPVDVEIGTTSKHSSKTHSPKVHSPEIHSTKVQSRLQSHPLIPETEASPDATGVQYSTNWAGAVLTAPPAGSTFNAISGTFTVPKPSVPSGKTGTYSGAAWIGIDGDTYSKAILQAGVQWSVDNSGGSPSYSVSAWHEWFPAPSINFGAMAVKVGDEISLSITSQSKSKGTIVIKNISSGQSITKSISAPSSTGVLGGQNAEWIVEDFSEGSSLVPFANFNTVTFSDATAGTSAGETVSPSGSTIIDIKKGSTVFTSASTSGNTVTVSYT